MKYHGYEILNDYIKDGDFEWKFTGNGAFLIGEKNGKKYFIKKNTQITYPTEGVAPALYELNKAQSEELEHKQKELARLMSRYSCDADNIVIEEEHFWDMDCKKFVTCSRFIEGCNSDDHDYAAESTATKIDMFIKIATLINKLHTCGVIHGDLKEKNFLFKKEGSNYRVYVIDFDSSYPVAEIPDFDKLAYSDGYESTECIFYKQSEDDANRSMITPKTDVFTLGVIFHKMWTGYFPTYDFEANSVAAAMLFGKVNPILHDSSDVIIGEDNGATIKSLIYWMLAKMPEDRPNMQEVIDILSDKSPVNPAYIVGSDQAKFTGLWSIHENAAEISEDDLKAKGVQSFVKITDGGSYKYQVAKDGEKKICSIDDLISMGLATPKAANLCEPWEEDNIEFISEAISAAGIVAIARVSAFKKAYKLTLKSGTSYGKSAAGLVAEGLAKYKEETATIEFGEPWEEDNAEYASAKKLEEKGVEKIEKITISGVNGYRVTYKDPTKSPLNVLGNHLKLMGLLVNKK